MSVVAEETVSHVESRPTFGARFTQQHRNTHILRSDKHTHTHAHTPLFFFSQMATKKKICSQTTVIKLISRLIDTAGATLRNTNSRTPRSTHSPALVRSLISSHGRVTAAALRERLCGCSHVYVWEISNDERMPFQVWARGASVQCSTLLTTRIHTHTRTLCMRVRIHRLTHSLRLV